LATTTTTTLETDDLRVENMISLSFLKPFSIEREGGQVIAALLENVLKNETIKEMIKRAPFLHLIITLSNWITLRRKRYESLT